jgi:hypothetical protein
MNIVPALGKTDEMEDMQAHLEKLRMQIAECELIRDLATDKAKRALFTMLADHFKVLASEIDQAIAKAAKT